jgi:hypothetical protein
MGTLFSLTDKYGPFGERGDKRKARRGDGGLPSNPSERDTQVFLTSWVL